MISVQYCFNHRWEERKKKKNFGDRAQINRKPVLNRNHESQVWKHYFIFD